MSRLLLWARVATVFSGLVLADARHAKAQRSVDQDSVAAITAARAKLKQFVGEWSFQWRGTERLVFTGTRSYRLLADSLRVIWEEEFDKPKQSGHGILWYHPGLRRYFATAVVAPSNEASLLAGNMRPADGAIVFDLVRIAGDSVPINRGMVRSYLKVLSKDSHTWSRFDDGWTVTFTRR